MLAAKFINEAFLGGVNTAGNAYLTYIWGSDCASYMQMLHFGVSLGSILATVVTEPFLSRPYKLAANASCTNLFAAVSGSDAGHRSSEGDTVTVDAVAGSGLGLNFNNAVATHVNTGFNVTDCSSYSDLTQLSNGAQQPSRVHFAYIIPGLFMMFASASFCYLNARHVHSTPLSSELTEKAVDVIEQESIVRSVGPDSSIETTALRHVDQTAHVRINDTPVDTRTVDKSTFDTVIHLSSACPIEFQSDIEMVQNETDANAQQLGECTQGQAFKKTRGQSIPLLPSLTLQWKCIYIALVSALSTIIHAVEKGHAQFFLTFCLTYIGMTKTKSSFLTSVFWFGFALGRFVAIFCISSFRSRNVLFLSSVLLLLSFTGLTLAAIYDVTSLLWVFNATAGLSMSIIVPSLFTWTTTEIFQITGKIFAVFMIATNVGGMVFPLLFGNMMERFSQLWFGYLLVLLSACDLIVMLGTAFLIRRNRLRRL